MKKVELLYILAAVGRQYGLLSHFFLEELGQNVINSGTNHCGP